MQRIEIAPDPVLLINVISRVSTLGQAYFFTGDERYAARAAAKVRTFFLDEHTGMYPSLAYAGMKPGVDKIGKPMVRRQENTALLGCFSLEMPLSLGLT